MRITWLPLLLMLAALLSLKGVNAVSIDVMPLRVDNPTPDGDGVVFIKLQTDPRDSTDAASLGSFQIVSIDFPVAGQALKLWNNVSQNCDGAVLSAGDAVPSDGKVCFWADTSVTPEFESSFTYAALDNNTTPEEGTPQTVTVVNYDVQTCPGIPDLGESGFMTAPPSPTVSITLSGLEIKFEITVAYLRNQTAWLVDFFTFDSTPGGDSADGTGRTCSNQASSHFTGIDFSQWWLSQPRANFDSSVDPSISNALNDTLFPIYDPLSTKWTITTVSCDQVTFTATIPTSDLISNAADNCQGPGSTLPAATANGLNYTANLYVFALRPKDLMNATAGYTKATFVYPFSFRLQTEVSDIETTSTNWAFKVAVDNMQTVQGSNLTLQLETTISKASTNSPDVSQANFTLVSYPNIALHTSLNEPAVLTRVGDNGNCGTGTTSPCVITWLVVVPELTEAQLGGTVEDYNQQYIGQFSFNWLTSTGDLLAANIIINAVAANSTDLGQLAVSSSIDFFRTESSMLVTSASGMSTPTFSSGEEVWVRHSFLVDSSDVSAYIFTLERAWVCWSSVADYVPTLNPGTGCSQDIPGVMEAALGQRILLFNVSVGIADVTAPAGSTQKSQIWGWTQVLPTDASWGGPTVQNGFGINALPLVFDSNVHNYYFHLVSVVSQAPLSGKRVGQYELENLVAKRAVASGSTGTEVKSISVYSDTGSSASALRAGWMDMLQ